MHKLGDTFAIADEAPPIDPRHLPVPVRNATGRALVAAGHIWVLHRKRVLQAVAGVAALIAVVGVYEARDVIAGGAVRVAELVQGEVMDAGFAIDRINITGQSLTSDAEIVQALAMQPRMSTFAFDAESARARLEALPAIEAASVRKIYPGNLVVTVSEKLPVARWRVGGVTWLVDMEGLPLAVDSGAWPELPLIVGEGAADDALIMIRAMERFSLLKKDLAALSRIGDRRWDLIYYTGLRVQLPELGVAQALQNLEQYQQRYALLDRDVTLIDLRVPGLVSYKPTIRDEEDDD